MDLRTFNFSRKKYDAEQWEAKLKEYFEFMKTQTWIKYEAIKSGEMAGQLIPIPTQTPLTRKNLCIFAQISEDTLRNYESNKEGYENHFEVTTHALNIIDNNQIEGAIVGAYNPNIVARLNGLSEKTENDNKNTNHNTNINFDNLTTEQIKDLLNENK